jgi:exopolysaccharide biosynthesis polyprenyl glycosylphosphotransferase
MFSRQHRKARLLFGLSDVILTTLAFEAAYRTRLWLPSVWPQVERVFYMIPPSKALVLGFALLAWTAAASWLNVYDRLSGADPRVILQDSLKQCTVGAVCVVVFEYVVRLDLSRPFLFLFFAYAWLAIFLFRVGARPLVGVIRREFAAQRYVVVVGAGEPALRVARMLERSEPYGVRLLGFMAESEGAPAEVTLSAAYKVWPIAQLPALLEEHVVDEIIFAVDSGRLADLEEVFLLCDQEGVRTRVAVNFFPHVNSSVYLERLGYTPLLTFSAAPHDEIRLMLKRATDVAGAALGLVALLPFMLAVGALVRLTSPGPVIFRQVRCGLNGRRFLFYKFRSMCADAEKLKPQLMHLNKRETVFKIPGDPRLTPIGRYLRKFSIDEWPQLWNVLKGDMSLVGPRPAVPEEVERYQRWQRRRLRMRPGLTCLWALAGRDELDFETWMKLDMQYIDNWSLALDWKILLKTIPRVLVGRGAN